MRTYCFKSCIIISHSNDNTVENKHIHTVEIAAYVRYKEVFTEIKKFEDMEVMIDSCFESYNESYLNEMPGFEEDTSIEHLGEMLFEKLDEILDDNGMFMERFEISETPLRTYILTRTA